MAKLRFYRRAVCIIILSLASGTVGIACAFFAAQSAPRTMIGKFEDSRSAYKSSDVMILDRNEQPLHVTRVNFEVRKVDWLSLSEISPQLISLVVASEDQRFYQHHGIDWRSLVRAATFWATGGSRQGASTITMQVASLLASRGAWRKGIWDKLDQIRAARKIDAMWSKEEVLEAYLNLVPFRGELRGVAAASQGIFGKDPHGLTIEESALLVAMLRSPNASIEKVALRGCRLLRSAQLGSECQAIEAIANNVLRAPQRMATIASDAPFVAAELIRQHPEHARITSTIDGRLQRDVSRIVAANLKSLREQNARDGAVIVVDNKSGDILAYVGNSGAESSARFVDGVRAKRSAGSTLKPFLYAAAIEERMVTAASVLDDAPLNLPGDKGVYRPEDYDREFRGPVSLRTALASSLNIPAVETLKMLGVEKLASTLTSLGMPLGKDSALYGYSMALGTPSVSLRQLTNAYRTLAQGGVWRPLRLNMSDSVGGTRQVFTSATAFIVSDILADRESRASTFGLENALSTRFWSAAKTGTSRDMTDNWCIGFTQRFSVGVWVGNFSGEPMWNVTGITGAAPIWIETMNLLASAYDGAGLGTPEPPPTVRQASTSGQVEWYLPGTEPTFAFEARASLASPRISYPAQGMQVALDPEIAMQQQKVLLRVTSKMAGVRYEMDGTDLGLINQKNWWSVTRGKHILKLRGTDGAVLDTAIFTVR